MLPICSRLRYLLFEFFWPTRFIVSDVLSLFHLVRYRNRAVWLSIWCPFLDISILFSSFGVLWKSRCCRRSSQVGYIVLSNPLLVCVRQHCHTTLFTSCLLWTNMFCLFRCIGPFLFCAISEPHNLTASRLKRKDSCFLLGQTLCVEASIARQLCSLFFIFGLTRFVFLDVLSLFHNVPYRNLAVWISICCHFCDISILFFS